MLYSPETIKRIRDEGEQHLKDNPGETPLRRAWINHIEQFFPSQYQALTEVGLLLHQAAIQEALFHKDVDTAVEKGLDAGLATWNAKLTWIYPPAGDESE